MCVCVSPLRQLGLDSLVSLTGKRVIHEKVMKDTNFFMIVIKFSPFVISLMGITEKKVVGRNQTKIPASFIFQVRTFI